MLGGAFIEELKKNKVLSNKSNKFSKLNFDYFNGKKALTLYGSTYLNYGYLIIEVEDAETLKVSYKDIVISCITGSKQVFIPLAIENNSKLTIEGRSKALNVYLLGAKFYNEKCNYLLPLKNYKVTDRGNFYVEGYSDKENFVANNLTQKHTFEKLFSSQVFQINNVLHHGCLFYSNGVYLSTDINNYTSSVQIASDIKCGTIVPSVSDKIIVAYIKDSKIFYKTLDENYSVVEEKEISKRGALVPISFVPIEVYGFNESIFAITWNNGTSSIFKYNGSEFVNIFTIKGDKIKIQLMEDELRVIKIDSYDVTINKYNFLDGCVTLMSNNNYYLKSNVNDYYFIDGMDIYYSHGKVIDC